MHYGFKIGVMARDGKVDYRNVFVGSTDNMFTKSGNLKLEHSTALYDALTEAERNSACIVIHPTWISDTEA